MRKFYVRKTDMRGCYSLYVVDTVDGAVPRCLNDIPNSQYLCILRTSIFKLPKLRIDKIVQIKKLPLQKNVTMSRPYYSYYFRTLINNSLHCGRKFEKYICKCHHLPSETRTEKPITLIKLKHR